MNWDLKRYQFRTLKVCLAFKFFEDFYKFDKCTCMGFDLNKKTKWNCLRLEAKCFLDALITKYLQVNNN